jgi:hypothetical protein
MSEVVFAAFFPLVPRAYTEKFAQKMLKVSADNEMASCLLWCYIVVFFNLGHGPRVL